MAERKFNVGDRVRVHHPASKYHGMETTVASELQPANYPMLGLIKHGELVHELELDASSPGCVVIARPRDLVPIYDGDQASKWSDCVWKPRKVGV